MTSTIKNIIASAVALTALAPALAQYPQWGSSSQSYPGQGYPVQPQYGPQYGYDQQPIAVNMCQQAALQEASRYGQAQIGQIGDIDHIRGGFKMKGGIAVSYGDRNPNGWHDRDHREWDGDHRDGDHGRDWRDRRYVRSGSFKCRIEYGRITELRLHGIDR